MRQQSSFIRCVCRVQHKLRIYTNQNFRNTGNYAASMHNCLLENRSNDLHTQDKLHHHDVVSCNKFDILPSCMHPGTSVTKGYNMEKDFNIQCIIHQMHTKFWSEYLKERNQVEDLGADWRIILNCFLHKFGPTMETAFIRLKRAVSDGPLQTR